MDNALERDIQTLERTNENLKFLIYSYIDGRVSYGFTKGAIANEVRFLERLIELRLGRDYVLLNTLWDLKHSPGKDKGTENDIIGDCTTLIEVSRIVLDELKEVRDK